jgi:hypothetical protein
MLSRQKSNIHGRNGIRPWPILETLRQAAVLGLAG